MKKKRKRISGGQAAVQSLKKERVKHKDCMKSIKLFTEKVMPNFKNDIDTEIKKVS